MSPTIYRTCSDTVTRLRKLVWAEHGLAAVEFALASPIILMLFFGAIELSRYILITQKAEKAAVTISDLVAQSEDVSTGDLNILIESVQEVMQPFNFSSDGYVVISSVSRVGSNPAVVNWQYTGGGTWSHASQIGTAGNDAVLPSGFTLDPNEGIIIAEVYYHFQPIFMNRLVLPDSATIYTVGVYKPRLGELTSLGS